MYSVNNNNMQFAGAGCSYKIVNPMMKSPLVRQEETSHLELESGDVADVGAMRVNVAGAS